MRRSQDVEVIDMTDDGYEPSLGRRRSHRKTEARVPFDDVMAQEREIARIKYEKTHYHPSAPIQLRKGEITESPGKRLKQKRAEERRSARQKLRRLSPRSPDGGSQLPLRSGVSLVKLEDNVPLHVNHTNGQAKTTLQSASLHSTAWRNLKFQIAPINLLPDNVNVLQPYALELDVALDEFDEELKSKCQVSTEFLKPKPLTIMTGTLGETRDMSQVDERVRQVIDEAMPLVKKCHIARVKAIITKTREQIAAYLEARPVVRSKTMMSLTTTSSPLDVSRLEKIAARKMLDNSQFKPIHEERPHYSVGRTESGYSEQVYPRIVTYLSKIAPIPRSTTCMLAVGTHRVEDDPIIRFVPYFSPGSTRDATCPHISTTERCKDTLVGMDDEVKEFVLRYVVKTCGGDQSVFESLQRIGAFSQPVANYTTILDRVTRFQMWKWMLHELELENNRNDISDHKKRTLAIFRKKCHELGAGGHIQSRLKPLPSHVILNYLQQDEELGVRPARLEQYSELARTFQSFFCRRCYTYSCRNHGRDHPVPVVRVDPRYPIIKATLRLWRRVEEDKQQAAEDAEMEADGDVPSEPDESISDTVSPSDSAVEAPSVQDNNSVNKVTRRSLRAQAAGTKTATAPKPNSMRAHVKKMMRSKNTDVSEYLGFDSIYQAMTQDKKVKLLSPEIPCGPHCSKSVSDTSQCNENKQSPARKKPWKGSEIALLNKLENCVGHNPCILAVLLGTRSCTDVADFVTNRETLAQDDALNFGLLRGGVYVKNRERSNGVLGNNYEHLRRTRSQRMKDRGANHEYVPCNHQGGSCDSAQCSCIRRDHYCEKACGCSLDCSNRFPGCHCDVDQCRTVECPCYFAARECDPDTCTSCGASELPVVMADDESKDKTSAQLKLCGNVNLMRGKMHRIGVSASETHGWGAYALESAKKGDFMYEYTGSLLSQDEAERRGNVYDKTTISFLFDLNEDSVVDATRKGNKSKFANHDSIKPKCFARIMLVNGDHRIGIYAKEDIAVGDELFFDYGYSGVIPDWSQARIGSSNDATLLKEDVKPTSNSVDELKERIL